MRLSIKGTTIAAGLLWGGVLLIVGLINLVRPAFGTGFLEMMTSVYPWFHHSHSVASVVIGTIDGLIDGAIAGCVFAWLYDVMLNVSNGAQSLEGRHT